MRNRERNRTRRRALGDVIERRPGSLKPFKASLALWKRIMSVIERGLSPVDRQIELDALPRYTSRGHGGKHRTKNRVVGSRAFQDRSRYVPAREFARGCA